MTNVSCFCQRAKMKYKYMVNPSIVAITDSLSKSNLEQTRSNTLFLRTLCTAMFSIERTI